MSNLNNSMVVCDYGDHPASPYAKEEKKRCMCGNCGFPCHEVTEVEYCFTTDAEDKPARKIELCDDCLKHYKTNKNIVLI